MEQSESVIVGATPTAFAEIAVFKHELRHVVDLHFRLETVQNLVSDNVSRQKLKKGRTAES